MSFSLANILPGAILALVQLLLALPWLGVAFFSTADWYTLRSKLFSRDMLVRVLIGIGACLVAPIILFSAIQDRESLELTGRAYGALLQIQITLDLFIVAFLTVLALWPKGGAVALAAFREGVRQPLFWMLTTLGLLAMVVSIFVPYFTFGEDYLMVKQLGYDTIMLAAVLFGGLAASLTISEEIEGRTAITVMSKPVSRRQFMIGKYAGIILAALLMFGLLGVFFEGILMVKHWWDKLDSFSDPGKQETAGQVWIGVVRTPEWVAATIQKLGLPGTTNDLLRGLGQWLAHSFDTIPGLILCYCQVMVLVGLAVSLATRLPMVVNLSTVLLVYFLSHLTPVLLLIADKSQQNDPGSTVPRLLGFVARVFDTVLPNLNSFSMDPALLTEAPPPPVLFAQYVGSVTLYGVFYTGIVLLFGLILFEDRDLA